MDCGPSRYVDILCTLHYVYTVYNTVYPKVSFEGQKKGLLNFYDFLTSLHQKRRFVDTSTASCALDC